MKIKPHLNFDGRGEEAIEFYTSLGAQLQFLKRWGDRPPGDGDPAMPVPSPQKVMHASLSFGDAQFYIGDGSDAGAPQFKGFMLILQPDSVAEVERLFAGLSQGGKVIMPPAETFFSKRYGQLVDRFGLGWAVMLYQD